MLVKELIAELLEHDGDDEVQLGLTFGPGVQYVGFGVSSELDGFYGNIMQLALRSSIEIDVAQMKADHAFKADFGGHL
ncbi:hypothetical protein [Gulosibacter molinativorax]|uniref:Uncharacterized protein n=1 Tax=Gulosibacter molinativorax TaxID=256821 RepID=A0ABT7C9F3_9MICO|nr:hypothetical protein [Gulosibacter molinativorax]MDJ1371779.1 hypothetical protein [Gulosibacter molinativorax]QUY60850.1 Hypotetical protein [Gulosibacter molinativorax]